jgi:hypothetical protein
MRNSFFALMAAAAAMTAVPSAAQVLPVQQQEATVAAGVVTPPNSAQNTAPNAVPFAAAAVRTYTYQPVCELRREQFADENGWRVRDVRVCR